MPVPNIPLCQPLIIIRNELLHGLFQLGSLFDVDRPLEIKRPAILEYQLCVVQKDLDVRVLARVQLVFHGAEVCEDRVVRHIEEEGLRRDEPMGRLMTS